MALFDTVISAAVRSGSDDIHTSSFWSHCSGKARYPRETAPETSALRSLGSNRSNQSERTGVVGWDLVSDREGKRWHSQSDSCINVCVYELTLSVRRGLISVNCTSCNSSILNPDSCPSLQRERQDRNGLVHHYSQQWLIDQQGTGLSIPNAHEYRITVNRAQRGRERAGESADV